MTQLAVLKNDQLELKVSPKVGGGIYSFRFKLDDKWVDVMRPTPEEALEKGEASRFSSFNMIPYSNRLENAVLHFEGSTYQLQANNSQGHSIHGDIRFRPLKAVSQDESHIKMTLDSADFKDMVWPFPFYTEIEYSIDGNVLITRMLLKNTGEKTMPGGMGIHPYFMRRLTSRDNKVMVRFPIRGVYPGKTQIPDGPWVQAPESIDFSQRKELTADYLDKCYIVSSGISTVEWTGSKVKMTIEADDIFRHLIVYCPEDEHDFFAVEPVTNCNNAFNMAERGIRDTGTLLIMPGQEISGEIRIKIER